MSPGKAISDLKRIAPPLLAVGLTLVLGRLLWIIFQQMSAHAFIPDEIMHLQVAVQSSCRKFISIFRAHAHPPGFFIILRAWTLLWGFEEGKVRALSLLFWLGSIPLFYSYVRTFSDRCTAAVAAIILMFPLRFLFLGMQLRGYTALVFFIITALHARENFWNGKKTKDTLVYGVAMTLMMSIHYSGLLVAASLIGLDLVEKDLRKDKALLRRWLAVIIPGWTLMGVVCFKHLRLLAGHRHWASKDYLSAFYFDPQLESIFSFWWRSTQGWFEYSEILPKTGFVMGPLFIVGLFALKERTNSLKRPMLYLLPFLVSAASAALKILPYGGSRHSVYLLPFTLVPCAFGLRWCYARLSAVSDVAAKTACAALLLLNFTFLWNTVDRIYGYRFEPAAQENPSVVRASVTGLGTEVAPQEVIYLDGLNYWSFLYYSSLATDLEKKLLPLGQGSFAESQTKLLPCGLKLSPPLELSRYFLSEEKNLSSVRIFELKNAACSFQPQKLRALLDSGLAEVTESGPVRKIKINLASARAALSP